MVWHEHSHTSRGHEAHGPIARFVAVALTAAAILFTIPAARDLAPYIQGSTPAPSFDVAALGAAAPASDAVVSSRIYFRNSPFTIRSASLDTSPISSKFNHVVQASENDILQVILSDTTLSTQERVQAAKREIGRYPTLGELRTYSTPDEPGRVEIASVDNTPLITAAWTSALAEFERKGGLDFFESRLLDPAPQTVLNIEVSLDVGLLDPDPEQFMRFDCQPRDIHAILLERGFTPLVASEAPAPSTAPEWWNEDALRDDWDLYHILDPDTGVHELLYVRPDWRQAHYFSRG